MKGIGFLQRKHKVAYKTTPGKHLFMVNGLRGSSAGFVNANLEGGKTYFVSVVYKLGLFDFTPYRRGDLDGEKFMGRTKGSYMTEQGPGFPEFENRHKPRAMKVYERNIAKWNARENQPAVNPEDGR